MSEALALDDFRTEFGRLSAARREPAWLRTLREEAFSHYAAKGLPTTRDEDWRHTSVRAIAETSFGAPRTFEATPAALAAAGLPDLGGPLAVFVNGRFLPEASAARAPGLRVRCLRHVVADEPALLEPRLGREARNGNAFTALNGALFEDGAVVEIAEGAVLAAPVQLAFFSSGGTRRPSASHPRVVVVAGPRSQACLVETHLGNGTYLTNAVSELQVGDGARLHHVKLQRESEQAFHVARVAAALGRDARLVQHHVALGALLARADIEVRFEGAGGECVLDGLFHADGDRLLDSHTRLDHAVPHCTSRESYRGIVDGRGRGVFHGRIVVRPDAQKTSAHQSNQNLLLSRQAIVHSTPQLEIFADDVKCKHGSTTGQLDELALFYLRSRGIGEREARGLLTDAFAGDVVRGLPHPALRAAVTGHLGERLGAGRELREALA